MNFEGLLSLGSIGWDIEIGYNNLFESTFGLSSLRYLWGRLFVHDNPSFHSIDGFNSLEYISQIRSLRNPVLETIEEFPSLDIIKDIRFIDNPLITDIENLSMNDSLKSHVIDNCLNVIGFDISNSVEHMYDLVLDEIMSLENMDNFSHVKSVENGLVISSNPNLIDIEGLNQAGTNHKRIFRKPISISNK